MKIAEIIEKSPLPAALKGYFKGRLEKEGVTPVLIESIKSMLRATEADAFARMGMSLDEDESPDLKKAAKLYSDAVGNAADKYLKAAEEASGAIVQLNKKAAKKIEKLESTLLKASLE